MNKNVSRWVLLLLLDRVLLLAMKKVRFRFFRHGFERGMVLEHTGIPYTGICKYSNIPVYSKIV